MQTCEICSRHDYHMVLLHVIKTHASQCYTTAGLLWETREPFSVQPRYRETSCHLRMHFPTAVNFTSTWLSLLRNCTQCICKIRNWRMYLLMHFEELWTQILEYDGSRTGHKSYEIAFHKLFHPRTKNWENRFFGFPKISCAGGTINKKHSLCFIYMRFTNIKNNTR